MDGLKRAEWFQTVPYYLFFFVIGAILIFFILLWYYVAYFFNALRRNKVFPKGKIKYKYAILIPARNEDKVIGNILESLKKQTYPRKYFDVYVIVESKSDPTIKITKKAGFESIIRKDLTNRRTKGYALDDAYQYLKEKGLEYDAFMVFDADNIVNKDYIDLMNDVKNQGFKVGMGYRNFTNASYNWVSSCSATLFAYMNQYTSRGRSDLFKKMTLTGTGYFVDSDIIDHENGWIFNGMTEDVELTTYCYYHNIPMNYYPIAQYFDEQPTDMKTVHKQHIRWVWGFFADRSYLKKSEPNYGSNSEKKKKSALFEFNVAIYPILAMIIMLFIAFVLALALQVAALSMMAFFEEFRSVEFQMSLFYWVIFYFILLYLPFVFISWITFLISSRYLKFSFKTMLSVSLTYGFFFFDFLSAFFDGLTHKYKRTTWDKIDHEGKVLDKQAVEDMKNEKRE